MDQINDDVRKVAIGLCKADRHSEDRSIQVAPGFSVPMWLTYVNRAEQLMREKLAFGK